MIAGQGTATRELLAEQTDLDALIVPVGGGGLLAGTLVAARAMNPDLAVFAAEPARRTTRRAPSQAGSAFCSMHPKPSPMDCARRSVYSTSRSSARYCRAIVTVSEEEIIAAMRLFLECTKLLIEPSSAVPLAALLAGPPARRTYQRVGVIITGGNVDLDRLPWQSPA